MKKNNVIDLAAYREVLNRKTAETSAVPTPAPFPTISEELKSAIEILIDRLRAQDPTKKSG